MGYSNMHHRDTSGLDHGSSGDGQHPDATTHITGEQRLPQRSKVLRHRLGYAEKGIMTSPADVEKKKPHLRGWQEKATTDPRRIHMESNRWSRAGILMPTGKKNRRWVFDVDELEYLPKLEKELGIQLRGTTTEIVTPSGGLHLHFLWPEDEGPDLRNSVGKTIKDGFEGLDVRGEGGQVLLPPSAGYSFGNQLPSVEAPPELVEWVRNRSSRRREKEGGQSSRPRVEVPEGEPVLEGGRNNALFWGCFDKRQEGASPAEVEGWGLAFNLARCVPALDEAEVIRTAGSAASYPVRRKGVSAEVEEIIENAWRDWFENMLSGGGRSKLRDCFRVLLEFGGRFGEFIEVIVEGEIRRAVAVSVSARQGALPAATSHMTFSRSMRRLVEAGAVILGGEERKEEEAQTWLILDPATKCYTPTSPPLGDVRGVTPCREPLQTPCFRWRGLVGNTGGGVLVAAEAFGPQTADEVAERLGWSRKRDLKTRHLDRLVELRLLEEERGIYRIPGDYRQRVEEVRAMRYTTVRRKKRESHDGPRKVVWVEEVGREASEAEREEKDRQRYEEQRKRFREALERKRAGQEMDPEVVDLLNQWAEERGEGWVEEADPIEVAWPELVDGVVQHDPDCGCSLCGDEPGAVA